MGILIFSSLTCSVTSSSPYETQSHFGYLGFFLRFNIEGPREVKVGESVSVSFNITADYDMYIALAKVSLSGAGVSWSEFLMDINLTEDETIIKTAVVKPTREGEIYCVVKARYDVWFHGWHSLYEEYGSVNFVISHARNITYSELLSERNALKSRYDHLESEHHNLESLNRVFQGLTGLFMATTIILTITTAYFAKKRAKLKRVEGLQRP